MTMQRSRTFVRTPRKEKVWAYNRNSGSGTAFTAGVNVHLDLLALWQSDQGISRPPSRATVIRIVGSIAGGNAADVTIPGLWDVSWGIAWLRESVLNASAGDGNIPDPEEPGQREVQWIQRGFLAGTSVAGAITRGADQGQRMSHVDLDIRQMRKQPTADYGLGLVTHMANGGDGTINGWVNLDIMLALA